MAGIIFVVNLKGMVLHLENAGFAQEIAALNGILKLELH